MANRLDDGVSKVAILDEYWKLKGAFMAEELTCCYACGKAIGVDDEMTNVEWEMVNDYFYEPMHQSCRDDILLRLDGKIPGSRLLLDQLISGLDT